MRIAQVAPLIESVTPAPLEGRSRRTNPAYGIES
jgi:hypothetical protein